MKLAATIRRLTKRLAAPARLTAAQGRVEGIREPKRAIGAALRVRKVAAGRWGGGR